MLTQKDKKRLFISNNLFFYIKYKELYFILFYDVYNLRYQI